MVTEVYTHMWIYTLRGPLGPHAQLGEGCMDCKSQDSPRMGNLEYPNVVCFFSDHVYVCMCWAGLWG